MISETFTFLLTVVVVGQVALLIFGLNGGDYIVTLYDSQIYVKSVFTESIHWVQTLLFTYMCYQKWWPRIIRNQRKLKKILCLIIESGFKITVFFLQIALAAITIIRIFLRRNPGWDLPVTAGQNSTAQNFTESEITTAVQKFTESDSPVERSEVTIVIGLVLTCILSIISIVHMGLVLYYNNPRDVPRRILLTMSLMVLLLLGTCLYFIAMNWYVWLKFTSKLINSEFRVCQIFLAFLLLIQGFMQILFLRRHDYHIQTFIGFYNISLNLVILMHLCACFVDIMGTSVQQPALLTALVATSPFEFTNQTIALMIFMPNVLIVIFHRFLAGMVAPRHEITPAVSEEQNMFNNLILKRESINLLPNNERLTMKMPVYSCSFSETGNINLLSKNSKPMTTMTRTRIDNEVLPSGYEIPNPKLVQDNPKGGGAYCMEPNQYVSDDRCDGVVTTSVQDCYSNECIVVESCEGGGGASREDFCIG